VSRKRIPTSPASPFYGYPAEVIAEWTGVSVGSAAHFKAGRRTPPTPVLRLFRQHRDGKVLGKQWEGYKIVGGKMFGPDGRIVRPSDIALMGLIWQALAEKDPESYYAILDKARRA
jgi:hypothetical protein